MATTAAPVVCVLSLLLLVRDSSPTCRDHTTVAVEQSNHSIQVGGTFENSTLTLYCNITDGELLYGQQLIWSEGGVEIKDSLTSRYQTSRTSSVLTLLNASDYRYGEYTCRCHNRFNYTVDTIEAFIRNSSNIFSPYCSMSASTFVPTEEYNDTKVEHHNVTRSEERVYLECEDDDAMLYKVHPDGTATVWDSPAVFTVTRPSDQSKFVCMVEELLLTEVHYVMIEDYFPLQLILPNAYTNEITIDTSRDEIAPPLCAVISSALPLSGKVFIILNEVPLFDKSTKLIPKGDLYVLTHAGDDTSSFTGYVDYKCEISTEWGRVSSEPYKIVLDNNIPPADIGLEAFLEPDSVIEEGSDVTVCCRVTSYRVSPRRLMVMVHYNGHNYGTQLKLKDISVYEYRTVIPSVTESSSGDYFCIIDQLLDGHCINKTQGVHLNVTSTSDNNNYESILATGSSVLAVTSSSMVPYTSDIVTTTLIKQEQPFTPAFISSSQFVQTASSSSQFLKAATSSTGGHSAGTVAIVPTIELDTQSSSPTLVVVITCTIFIIVAMVCMLLTTIVLICTTRWRKIFANGFPHSPSIGDDFDVDSISLSHMSTAPSLNFRSGVMMKFVQERLTLSKWYIPYDKLQVHEKLGSGAFGMVKKATGYGVVPGQCETIVAVKMLKNYATEDEQRDIITEFNMLQRVGTHKNIVNLIGASSYKDQLVVIVEYCSGGNLLNYLRRSRTDAEALTLNRQLNMVLQVAEGMEYLAKKQCIHRDLAARNILITSEGTLKVADFGLARETYHSMYKQLSKSKVPFKWMSPESIFDNIYTVKSDVWSFGVLLWEIGTLGELPYPGKTIDQLREMLKAHMVMEKNDSIPPRLYELMLKCWKHDPNKRPSFTELVNIVRTQATVVENCASEVGDCERDRGYECSEDSDAANNDADSLDTPMTIRMSFPQETCPPFYNNQSQSESIETGTSGDSGIMNEYMEPKCQVLWHSPPDNLDYIRTTII